MQSGNPIIYLFIFGCGQWLHGFTPRLLVDKVHILIPHAKLSDLGSLKLSHHLKIHVKIQHFSWNWKFPWKLWMALVISSNRPRTLHSTSRTNKRLVFSSLHKNWLMGSKAEASMFKSSKPVPSKALTWNIKLCMSNAKLKAWDWLRILNNFDSSNFALLIACKASGYNSVLGCKSSQAFKAQNFDLSPGQLRDIFLHKLQKSKSKVKSFLAKKRLALVSFSSMSILLMTSSHGRRGNRVLARR